MEQKTIGIIGFRGLVGNEALEVLRGLNKYYIRLGSRSVTENQDDFPDDMNVSCHQVDIYDTQALTDFCAPCDLVINCAGPASKIKSTAAEVCIKNGIVYVDPAGDKTMKQSIEQCLQRQTNASALCLISSGVYPGLTEILINYVNEQYFDRLDTIKEYLAGKCSFSENGAYDVIASLANDEGIALAKVTQGGIEKLSFGFDGSVTLPAPFFEMQSMPLVTEEFQTTVEKIGVKEAIFFNTFTDDSMLNQFISIKMSGEYQTEAQKISSARKLIDIYETASQTEDALMIHLESTGVKNHQQIEQQLTFYCPIDWNALSGTVAGLVADIALSTVTQARGCYFAEQLIPATPLVEYLMQVKKAEISQQTRVI